MMKSGQDALQASYEALAAALERTQAENARLADQMAKMEIKAGDVKVDMPPRAKSFRIEYDDVTGQPERLIPEYETLH